MLCIIAHCCPAHPLAAIDTSLPTSPVYILGMTVSGMEYPFGQSESAFLAVLPPSFFVHMFPGRA